MTVEIKCKDCGRFLGTTDKSVQLKLKCANSKCKALNEYKITFASDLLIQDHHKHDQDSGK